MLSSFRISFPIALVLTIIAVWFVSLVPGFLNPCAAGDALAYVRATAAFFAGANPYSSAELKSIADQLCSFESSGPVWNPPLLFTTFGLLIWKASLFPYWIYIALLCSAAVGLAYLGSNLAEKLRVPMLVLFAVIITFFPLFSQLFLGQFSSMLSLCVLAGFVLVLKDKIFLGALLISIAAIKPHVFLLPFISLLAIVPIKKLPLLIAGGVCGGLALSAVAETVHPGIHQLWLNREAWPQRVIGSGISGAVRIWATKSGFADPTWMQIVAPVLGVGTYLLLIIRHTHWLPIERFLAAVALNPLFTPYGFAFDQVGLLTVEFYMIAKARNDHEQRQTFALLLIAHLACIASQYLGLDIIHPEWNLLTLAIPIIFLLKTTPASLHTDTKPVVPLSHK